MKIQLTVLLFALLVPVALFMIGLKNVGLSAEQKIRPPLVAGGFYPADPNELGKMIDGFLAKASLEKLDGNLVALICPHAGYQFSGGVAAYAYIQLKGRSYDRVVVLAPSHYESFPFSSIYDGEAYHTPLGDVPVDHDFAAKLVKLSSSIKISDRGHGPVEMRGQQYGEHAIEDQLPFLQRVLGQFKMVPIVMGDISYDNSRALGVALAKAVEGTNTLILVSSDLSHYHTYDDAERMDHQILKTIQDWDYLTLSQNLERNLWNGPCGGGPIVAAMIAADRMGAHHAQLLKYANSGDVTGDKTRVVGYGALAIVADNEQENKKHGHKSAEFSLTPAEKQELLKIARQSVEVAVREKKILPVPANEPEALRDARGAFVTLKEHGDLRGCIGYMSPVKPLAETVRDVAAYAALEDRRFRPVNSDELPLLEYEISVLSPLRKVEDINQIHVGQHGLLIRKGEYEGVLLPQVPTEQGWDRKTFLEQVCVKAGLPEQAWKDEDADLFMFTALVFGEPHNPKAPAFDEPSSQKTPGLPGPPAPGSLRP
ncbi:MAG: AmmeMemoRadiSam system protein B [Terriglobia bacterium]|jgi:AmmeMemoRadiSam system protein B/AmmeMemoRadiSam system protein A